VATRFENTSLGVFWGGASRDRPPEPYNILREGSRKQPEHGGPLKRSEKVEITVHEARAILARDEVALARNVVAKANGRMGGLARARSLSAKERSELSRKAALARARSLSAKKRSEISRKGALAKHAKRKLAAKKNGAAHRATRRKGG
jgi:hypothetical protein